MAFKIRRKGNVNVRRVVSKIAITVIGLYVGGTILTELGAVMNQTASPFYQGLSLIGWTVATVTNATSSSSCALNDGGGNTIYNCITGTSGTGILTVVGLIAIASIVLEFVQVRF